MKLVGEKEQHRVASSHAQTTHNSSAAPPFGLYVSLVFDNYSYCQASAMTAVV